MLQSRQEAKARPGADLDATKKNWTEMTLGPSAFFFLSLLHLLGHARCKINFQERVYPRSFDAGNRKIPSDRPAFLRAAASVQVFAGL